jgi:hypothetical protein
MIQLNPVILYAGLYTRYILDIPAVFSLFSPP